MSKQLARKENTDVSTEVKAPESWGGEGITSSDILIGKILLMQGLSDLVSEEKAQTGDLVDSVTNVKLGDKKTPLEIVPISMFKTWVISRKAPGSSKFEYEETQAENAENKDWQLDDVTLGDGTVERRDRVINFYVLLRKEIESGEAMPRVVSFRRTSYKAGKKVATHMAKMNMLRENPAARSLMLTCKTEKNDLGTYYVFDIEPGTKTDPAEQVVAREWFNTIKKGQTRVDESDLSKAEEPTTIVQESGPAKF